MTCGGRRYSRPASICGSIRRTVLLKRPAPAAAMNGVPSLSVRDGWWIEGHFEWITGWSIGFEEDPGRHDIEIASLYDKLERVILPL
jgi:hypothetical protein